MQKMMPIFKCHGCNNYSTIDCRSHFCVAANHREIETNIFTEIPEWCPLDDVPQGKCDFCGGDMVLVPTCNSCGLSGRIPGNDGI